MIILSLQNAGNDVILILLYSSMKPVRRKVERLVDQFISKLWFCSCHQYVQGDFKY